MGSLGIGVWAVLLAVLPGLLTAALGAWSVYLRSGPSVTLLVLAAFPASITIFGTYYVMFLRRAMLVLTSSHLVHQRALMGTTAIPRSAIARVVVAHVATANMPPFPHTFVLDRNGHELLAGAWGAWDQDEISELWRKIGVPVEDQGDVVFRRGDLYAAFPGIRWHRRYGTVSGAFIAAILGGVVAWSAGVEMERGALVTTGVTLTGAFPAAGIGALIGAGVDAWSLSRARRRSQRARGAVSDA